MLNPSGPRSCARRAAASRMRARVARTNSRRVGLNSHSSAAQHGGDRGRGVKSCSRAIPADTAPHTLPRFLRRSVSADERELDFAVEDLLEQVPPATRAPQRQFRVTDCREAQNDEVVADIGAQVRDRRRGARDRARRRRAGSRPACARDRGRRSPKRGETRLGRLRVAAPVVPNQRGEERDLRTVRSRAAAPFSTRYAAWRWWPLRRHVLTDVVEQRRRTRAALDRPTRARAALRLVEQAQREARNVRRVRARQSCSVARGRRPQPGATRAGRRDQSSGSWVRTASSTMPSRSAQSLTVSVSTSNRSSAV